MIDKSPRYMSPIFAAVEQVIRRVDFMKSNTQIMPSRRQTLAVSFELDPLLEGSIG